MKQNISLVLFKSLALHLLILSNLTFQVLCSAPASAPAPETVEQGILDVPKKNICDIINSHYKVKKNEDFFQSLKAAVAPGSNEYKFKFNSSEMGGRCFDLNINSLIEQFPSSTAEVIFSLFKEKVAKVEKNAVEVKKPAAVTAATLQTFMKEFEFKDGKFVLKTDTGNGVALDDIADNLVVYLDCSLDDLKAEVNEVKGIVKMDTANSTLSKEKAIDDATKNARAAFMTAVFSRFSSSPTKNNVSLREVLSVMNMYLIKTEYHSKSSVASQANASTNASSTLKSTGGMVNASAYVEYAIIDSATITYSSKHHSNEEYNSSSKYTSNMNYSSSSNYSSNMNYSSSSEHSSKANYSSSLSDSSLFNLSANSNVSFIQMNVTAADIGNDKIFLPGQFINTTNELAKDIFLSISDGCHGDYSNVLFSEILSRLSSTNFVSTVNHALSKCILEKTVTSDEFNDAFDHFSIKDSDYVHVQVKDITPNDNIRVVGDNCQITLCWLSSDTKTNWFSSYIAWLEKERYLKLSMGAVDKKSSIEKFFALLKNSLTAYRTALEAKVNDSASLIANSSKQPKNSPSSTEDGNHPSNSSNKSKKMPTYVTVIIIVCSFGSLTITVFVIVYYYFSKDNKI